MALGSHSFSNHLEDSAKDQAAVKNARSCGWKHLIASALLCAPVVAIGAGDVRVNASTNPVQVYVNAWSTENRPVTGLTTNSFRIYEDNVEQSVEAVLTPEDNAVAVLFLMDYSPSIRTVENSPRVAIETAVKTALSNLDSNDRAAVVKFGLKTDSGYEAYDFTSNYSELQAAVDKNPSNSGGTRLYDALNASVEMFGQANITGSSRSIILLSDGYDTSSDVNWVALREKLQATGVSVFTIGYGPQLDEGRQAMQDIAALSGGTYKEAAGLDNDTLQTLYAQVAEGLTNEYILTYSSGLSLTNCSAHTLMVDIDAVDALDYSTSFQRCIEVGSLITDTAATTSNTALVADTVSGGGGGAQGMTEALALTLLGLWGRRRSQR